MCTNKEETPTALLNFTVGSSGRMAQSPVAYTCDGCVNVAMLWNVTIHSLFVYFFSGTTPCLQIYFSKPYIQLSPKSVRFLKEIPHKHTQQTLTLYCCFIHVVVWLQCHRRGSYIEWQEGWKICTVHIVVNTMYMKSLVMWCTISAPTMSTELGPRERWVRQEVD